MFSWFIYLTGWYNNKRIKTNFGFFTIVYRPAGSSDLKSDGKDCNLGVDMQHKKLFLKEDLAKVDKVSIINNFINSINEMGCLN